MRTAMVGKAIAAGVAELQWKGLIAEVRKLSKFRSCLAVCDMSSAMLEIAGMDVPYRSKAKFSSGTFQDLPPYRGALRSMDIATSLSLVLSEVADDPFRNKVIAFDEDVELVELGKMPATLTRRATELRS